MYCCESPEFIVIRSRRSHLQQHSWLRSVIGSTFSNNERIKLAQTKTSLGSFVQEIRTYFHAIVIRGRISSRAVNELVLR